MIAWQRRKPLAAEPHPTGNPVAGVGDCHFNPDRGMPGQSRRRKIPGMFQVHLVCRPRESDRLVDLLTTDAGVRNIVVLPASARRPDGDVIQFDLAAGSANPVLRQLHDLGIGEHSPVAVHIVDAALPEPPPPARPGRRRHLGEIAPVWELLYARIRADAIYAPSFYLLLIIAGLIAAVGILTNSQILIVGAMVVGPEYSAIISTASGVDSRNWAPVRAGLIALVSGFLLAIVVTLIFAWCIKALGKTPTAYRLGLRPVSALIDSPNLFSVVVAVLAGIVGVVSLAESRANALIGVFISITTIPAAADAGVSLAYHLWSEAGGSALQLLLNVGLLIMVGALVIRAMKILWREVSDPPGRGRGTG
jgi:uncharacterized hydrophobic protein (TIGR00271 family)